MSGHTPPLHVIRLTGLTDYATAWALQRAVHAEVAAGTREDTLLLLEHPPTFTMGRRGGWANLKASPEELERQGFQLWNIDRGGDITYHGPGQLVGYPIVNMKRSGLELGPYIRGMEQAHIDFLARYAIEAERVKGFTGVWCGLEKVTAIGVRVTSWTTLHGFAINLATDLSHFDHIIPCGLEGKSVTSFQRKRPDLPLDFEALASELARTFARAIDHTAVSGSAEPLPQPDPADIQHLLDTARYRVAEEPQPHPGARP